MKVFRIAVVVAAVALAAFTILAQTQTRPATPANVAIIDSSAFSDEKTGIARVITAGQQIQVKFEPLRNEITSMRQRLATMRSDLQKKSAIQDAATTAKQTDEADQLEIQIKRKSEDAPASLQRERQAMLDPLEQDVGNALKTSAQSPGWAFVIDANLVPILYAASSLDITQDFINDYNRTHPAGALMTAPARPATTPPARPASAAARAT